MGTSSGNYRALHPPLPYVHVSMSASMAQFLLLMENVEEGSQAGEGREKGRCLYDLWVPGHAGRFPPAGVGAWVRASRRWFLK